MLKHMKIRTRLLLSYLIIIVFLLISGITAVVMLGKVGDSLKSFYEQQFQTIDNSWNARRTVFSCRANILQACLDDDPTATNEYVQEARDEFQGVRDAINKVETTFQGDKSLIEKVKNDLTQAEPYLEQMCNLASKNQNDDAYIVFMQRYKPIMDDLRETLSEIASLADQNGLAKVEAGESLARTADVIIITLIIISIIISIVLAIVISSGIRKPINEMMRVSADIAKGNLDTEIEYASGDELGEMANSMREMTGCVRIILTDVEQLLDSMGKGDFNISTSAEEAYVGQYKLLLDSINSLNASMSDTLIQIDVSADQVNSGGEQVSSSAQALAQGATEQASSIQELAASINDISQQVETTAEHAKTAKEENMQSHDEIQVCSEHMEKLMEAMSDIDNKSKEISKVIKTIEDIAFQTNILALNAAVEAARAGSAGKGFAVVADEVRNLATKSQEASKSTASLIDDTVRAVSEGTRYSSETEQALKAVVESAQKVLNAVSLISEATEEQSRAVNQVSIGIDQISSVVQTNSATAEQSAAASQELSGQANLLKEMVGRFNLRRDDHDHINASSSHVSSSDHFTPSIGDKY